MEQKKTLNQLIRGVLYMYIMMFPWVTYNKVLNISMDERTIWSENVTGFFDSFLYGKSIFTMIIALLLVLLFLYKGIRYREWTLRVDFNSCNIRIRVAAGCLLCFIGANILSFVSCKYKHVALWGNVNSCEGLLVILSYIVLFIAAIEVFQFQKGPLKLKRIFSFVAIIVILLTLIEFLYMPLSQILNPDHWKTEFVNMVSLTFYNSSYFGGFMILILPLIGIYWIHAQKRLETIFYGVLFISLIFCTISSKSTAAFYLMIIEVLFILIYYIILCIRGCNVKKVHFIRITTIIAMLVILFIINSLSANKLITVISDTKVNATSAIHNSNYFAVKNISVDANQITISGMKNTLYVIMKDDNSKFEFLDSDKNSLDVTVEDSVMHFTAEYSDIKAWMENGALTFDLGYKGYIRFYIYKGNFYPMLTDGTIVTDIMGNGLNAGKIGHFASGRGYFWLNSIPVLKNTLILGHGAGTFEMYFKQFDFAGLLNYQGNVDLIIDKPHNLYIQIAEQSGIVSAIAFIIFLGILFFESFRTMINKKDTSEIGIALTIAIVCFSIFELVTDSCITVNPLFWILMGIQSTLIWNRLQPTEYNINKIKKL